MIVLRKEMLLIISSHQKSYQKEGSGTYYFQSSKFRSLGRKWYLILFPVIKIYTLSLFILRKKINPASGAAGLAASPCCTGGRGEHPALPHHGGAAVRLRVVAKHQRCHPGGLGCLPAVSVTTHYSKGKITVNK